MRAVVQSLWLLHIRTSSTLYHLASRIRCGRPHRGEEEGGKRATPERKHNTKHGHNTRAVTCSLKIIKCKKAGAQLPTCFSKQAPADTILQELHPVVIYKHAREFAFRHLNDNCCSQTFFYSCDAAL